MLAPTPMLRPSPMDIGGLFSGTFQALKKKFWLFLAIAMLPGAVLIAIGIVSVVIMIGGITSAVNGGDPSLALSSLAIVGVLGVVGMIAYLLLQLRSQGMMSVTAYEVAQGKNPTFGSAWEGTKGLLGRLTTWIFICIGAILVAVLIFGGVVWSMVSSIMTMTSRTYPSSPPDPSGIIGAAFVLVILPIVLVPLEIWLLTKLLYLIPAAAIEGLRGMEPLKRSWSLTKGSFWRTFGYYIVASMAVALVSYVVSFVGQLLMIPATTALENSQYNNDPTAALAALSTMVPIMIIVWALQILVTYATMPFLYTYVTYMYLDQVRRSELPAQGYGYGYGTPYGGAPSGYPQGGYAAQPGYPGAPAPGAPSGQPGYPAQGGYGQSYPTSTGADPSGQAYPNQGAADPYGQGSSPQPPAASGQAAYPNAGDPYAQAGGYPPAAPSAAPAPSSTTWSGESAPAAPTQPAASGYGWQAPAAAPSSAPSQPWTPPAAESPAAETSANTWVPLSDTPATPSAAPGWTASAPEPPAAPVPATDTTWVAPVEPAPSQSAPSWSAPAPESGFERPADPTWNEQPPATEGGTGQTDPNAPGPQY